MAKQLTIMLLLVLGKLWSFEYQNGKTADNNVIIGINNAIIGINNAIIGINNSIIGIGKIMKHLISK